jgi:vacuolar-type H+-ATPase subunit F/Vma7
VGRIVVLGEAIRADGFALSGATVIHAQDRDAVRRAWAAMPDDVEVVVVTPAAWALDPEPAVPEGVITVVMPS